MQHAVAGQAEDVVDAVVLAPRHGLGPSVVAVPPECEPGARPVPADAPHQVLQQGADLGARGRLAGAQENRHRLAALHMVDMHRQEAPRVVMGVEQRQLLAAVHRVAGVVDVQRDRRWRGIGKAAAEDVDQGGRHARHLDARGRVLQTAHGGLGTQVAAALRRPADGQLEQRIVAQGVAVVGVFITAGDREHAEAQHRRQRVDHPFRVAPLPDAARQRLGQPEPALGPRAAAPGRRPTRSARPRNRRSPSCGLRAGRSNGSRVSSVMAGVALSLSREKCAWQRISTRSQRVTPCPPSHRRAVLNKWG